jgi:hypothetical protein
MGGPDSSAPLLPDALAPLTAYPTISPDDPYWNAIFSRRILPVHSVPLAHSLIRAAESHSQNIAELLHMATVGLIDLNHRFELGRAPPRSSDWLGACSPQD